MIRASAPAASIAALSKTALARFRAFSAAQQRDYLEWIIEARREDTRARRIARAAAWIADGRTRNWQYERAR